MSLRSKVSTHITGSGLFWPMVSLIVLVALFYMYSVNRTVILVAQRDNLESKISENRAVITTLESSYITAMGNITMEVAEERGYTEAKVIYIPKKSVSILTRSDTIQ